MFYKKIVGAHTSLIPIDKDNFDNMTLWSSDLKNNFNFNKISANGDLNDLDSLSPKLKLDYDLFYIVDNKNEDSKLGTISINDINFEYKTGRLDFLMHNKQYLKNGMGKEAVKLSLDYAFNVLNLLNVNLMVYEYNDKFIKLYSSAGFKKCGKIRQAKEVAGKRYDLILMDILSNEYKKPSSIQYANLIGDTKPSE